MGRANGVRSGGSGGWDVGLRDEEEATAGEEDAKTTWNFLCRVLVAVQSRYRRLPLTVVSTQKLFVTASRTHRHKGLFSLE